MTDETKVPTPTGEELPDAQGTDARTTVKPTPPRAGPVHPTPAVPPPPPPAPEPKAKIPKGMGPPGWMAPVTALLLIVGLGAFAFSAWSYVSGMGESLRAGKQALLAVQTMEDASASTLATQEKALTSRAIDLKREAISAAENAESLRGDAFLGGFLGIGPLLVGFFMMLIYRKKKERARAARVR
jgi:hypothetical protein